MLLQIDEMMLQKGKEQQILYFFRDIIFNQL